MRAVLPLEGWARQSRDGSTVQEDSALDLGLKGQLPPRRATPAGDVPVGSTAGNGGAWLGSGPLSALGAERPGGATGSLLDELPGDPGLGAAAEGLLTQRTKAATFSPQSLTGHTSPVESVRLNTPEELIVAGSQSGSIRVWDLEAAKSRCPRLPPPTQACGCACPQLSCPATFSRRPVLTRLGATLLVQ